MQSHAKNRLFCTLVALATAPVPMASSAAPDGELRLEVIDSVTRKPLPVRVKLSNARGRTVRARGLGAGHLGDHFYLPGSVTLGLRRGAYLFALDAGAEYRTQQGNFEIERHADDSKTVEMRRFANLGDEGWFAGDLDAVRPARDLPIMALAEGLHYVPTIAWHYADNKWQASHTTVRQAVDPSDDHAEGRMLGPSAALVELDGGPLLIIGDKHLDQPPLEIDVATTSLDVLRRARAGGLRVIAATPTAWDLPLWLASGELDAIALINRSTIQQDSPNRNANARPRDKTFFPGRQGLARWGQAIYFHVLNCGLKITPVTGSGSGANERPLGINRTYVHHYNAFDRAGWWRGVENGATVVTNGPLIRPNVGGDPPGAVFRIEEGETLDFQIALNLASRTKVEYLEIIKDGEVEAEVRLSDWASKGGRLPPVSFDASGWFAIRAATVATDQYQFALTAPYYVESPSGPRISRRSVEFFLTWLDELEKRIGKSTSCTQQQVDAARIWWQALLAQAKAP